jgi:hypothetical protein
MKTHPLSARLSAVLVCCSLAGLALTPSRAARPNGAAPRPFYLVAHNPNTLAEAQAALERGCNALEPDVTECTYGPNHPCSDGSGGLRIYHDSGVTPTRSVLTIEEYCDGINLMVRNNPNLNLALITWDVKPDAAKAAYGTKILNAIRNHLNVNGVSINNIISVGTRDDSAVFDNILGLLGPREGVMVDGEDDAANIVGKFLGLGYAKNTGYGDGTGPGNGPHLHVAMDKAAYYRATKGHPKIIPYVFAIDLQSSMRDFIDDGVDGIIPDDLSDDIDDLVTVVNERVATGEIRRATAKDNPFQPLNEAYGLEIHTANAFEAGTNADLKFTLNGTLGSSDVVVNAGEFYYYRMEQNDTNYVTIPSRNLGTLQSITVYNNDTGTGPDWKIDKITVKSARWLSPVDGFNYYNAIVNDWVDGGETKTFTLLLLAPIPTIQSWVNPGYPGLTNIPIPNGTQTQPWQDFFSAYNYSTDSGVIFVGGGDNIVPLKVVPQPDGTYWGRLDRPRRIDKISTPPFLPIPARLVKP